MSSSKLQFWVPATSGGTGRPSELSGEDGESYMRLRLRKIAAVRSAFSLREAPEFITVLVRALAAWTSCERSAVLSSTAPLPESDDNGAAFISTHGCWSAQHGKFAVADCARTLISYE